MNKIQFASIIKDLELHFEHKLSNFQRENYFDRLSSFDEKPLREAVKYLYDTHSYKRFPLIAEIRDAIFKAMSEMPEQTTDDIQDDFECEVCHGIGRMVEEVTEASGYFHSVEKFCICPKGQREKDRRAEWKRSQRRKV